MKKRFGNFKKSTKTLFDLMITLTCLRSYGQLLSLLFLQSCVRWWSRKLLLLITFFRLLLVNFVVQKMRTQVTNTISIYKLTNALLLLICFKLNEFVETLLIFKFIIIFQKIFMECYKPKINLKQINNKKKH